MDKTNYLGCFRNCCTTKTIVAMHVPVIVCLFWCPSTWVSRTVYTNLDIYIWSFAGRKLWIEIAVGFDSQECFR